MKNVIKANRLADPANWTIQRTLDFFATTVNTVKTSQSTDFGGRHISAMGQQDLPHYQNGKIFTCTYADRDWGALTWDQKQEVFDARGQRGTNNRNRGGRSGRGGRGGRSGRGRGGGRSTDRDQNRKREISALQKKNAAYKSTLAAIRAEAEMEATAGAAAAAPDVADGAGAAGVEEHAGNAFGGRQGRLQKIARLAATPGIRADAGRL